MGRRKSKRKPPPKKKMTGDLESQFTCPFCNHEKSCDVKMYFRLQTQLLQGEEQKYWDHIMHSLLGGVPDPHYLYPYPHS
ncbi:hypothetical protein L3Q82_019842 [Scortum barcoo]|uniref:Uncharacterized protein n=1 Tax=Scortum barcoo TaxID=214431 RepID=A0ACB8VCL7_9TELE|nr:hypothetical protein L3Q82_019842 [Scortum barcoo]